MATAPPGTSFNPVHALEIVMKAQSAKKEALMIKRLSTAMVI
jgi:hypothetical protein